MLPRDPPAPSANQTPALDRATALSVTVNGERRDVAPGTTVAALLAALGASGARVAVERNRQIVPRAEQGELQLADGDQLEVVTFVGGG